MEAYQQEPDRYELRSGQEKDAPDCPFGNRYAWVGYDKDSQSYVRFTKSVFKLLINKHEDI